ncbi:MAG: hypothetical protein ACOVS5_17990 [Oligoflexus sp.]|jgi:hypothetical protein
MLRLTRWIGVLGIVAISSGCGKDDNNDKPKLFDLTYSIQENEGLELAAASVSGTGKVAFEAGLAPSSESSRNLTFELSLEDGGRLDVISFADAQLNNGLVVSLSRTGSVVTLTAEGAEGAKLIPLELTDAAAPFVFSVDIHNQENATQSHVLAWLNSKEAPVEESAYLLNDEEIVAGKGTFLALGLTKAKVEKLELSDAKSTLE